MAVIKGNRIWRLGKVEKQHGEERWRSRPGLLDDVEDSQRRMGGGVFKTLRRGEGKKCAIVPQYYHHSWRPRDGFGEVSERTGTQECSKWVDWQNEKEVRTLWNSSVHESDVWIYLAEFWQEIFQNEGCVCLQHNTFSSKMEASLYASWFMKVTSEAGTVSSQQFHVQDLGCLVVVGWLRETMHLQALLEGDWVIKGQPKLVAEEYRQPFQWSIISLQKAATL